MISAAAQRARYAARSNVTATPASPSGRGRGRTIQIAGRDGSGREHAGEERHQHRRIVAVGRGRVKSPSRRIGRRARRLPRKRRLAQPQQMNYVHARPVLDDPHQRRQRQARARPVEQPQRRLARQEPEPVRHHEKPDHGAPEGAAASPGAA